MSITKTTAASPAAFEIKGSSFTLLVLCLKSSQLPELEKQLQAHLAKTPDYFNFDPIVIDLCNINQNDVKLDFKLLINLLKQHKLAPIGICNGNQNQVLAAQQHGLGIFADIAGLTKPKEQNKRSIHSPSKKESQDTSEPATPGSKENFRPQTKVITQPIRTGQQIYAQDCDLIVLAPVNAGAEIISDGNIHVYAPLRGRALAGVKGNTSARIFCLKMEAELVSIAGCYRVIEEKLPENIQGEGVQISLDGERLVFEPLLSNSTDNKRTVNWQK
ncbi:MAG: septum site-determining protein MinC [Proteobacteria bacterium]|nr:septum site-determining protein MinC [Pseudomonadota bacterium]MDE3208555.1 septum site-determining protein MinC [Pseudomonadota bacterium]